MPPAERSMFAAFFSICRRFVLCRATAVLAGLVVPLTGMAQGTNPIPGDGPQCRLSAPAAVDFNTVLQPSLTFSMSAICTRYPVLWEWTAPPLDYTGHNMAGQNALFQPLFNSGVMTWTYDNRKVTTVSTIPITITATGTYTFAVRAKDADYIPPNNQPAGFWGPWGAPGFPNINDSGAWVNISATCRPQSETRVTGPGGSLACTGGQISTLSETRTFCADSVTPTWGPWIPSTTCACPSGQAWNGVSCVPVPICTVAPTPASSAPGQTTTWNVTCDSAPTSVVWTATTPPTGGAPCSSGTSCAQTYTTPQTVCYAVAGVGVAGTGPRSTPACATVACPPGQAWSSSAGSCGVPPTISAPNFSVGTPAPSTIPITVTGTPQLTCTATNLPAGFVMQSNCSLVSTSPGTAIPPVPSGCKVTVNNAWGADSKDCTAYVEPSPSCTATWAAKPLALSSKLLRFASALHTSFGVTGQPVYVQDANPARADVAGYVGSAPLQIAVSNADTYSVSCDGAPTLPPTLPSIDPITGKATVPVTYTSRTALPAVTYSENGVWDTYMNSYASLRCDSFGCYPIQFVGSDGNTYNAKSFYTYSASSQNAITPVSQSVCRVTVTNSNTGASASCASDTTQVVAGGQAYCRMGLKVGEWEYQLANGSVTPSKPADTTTIARSYMSTSAPAVEVSPNTIFAEAQIVASGVQLQSGPFVPPPGAPAAIAPWNNNIVSCRKRKLSAANLAPAWQVFSLPATGTYVSSSAAQSWGSFGLPVVSRNDGYVAGSTFTGLYQEPAAAAWRDSLDSINEQYELECSYSGTGYNNTTGATESVSCSSTWTYKPGAVCMPSASFGSGPAGIQYADGSRSYSGYSAGWTGPVRYVGEKVTLAGNDGVDANSSAFSAATPKLARFGAAASSTTHLVVSPRQSDLSGWLFGSTHGWLRDRLASYTDANLALAGDVVATAALGVNSLQQSPLLMRGCDGVGGGSWYTSCNHRTVLNVERTLFPGTSAERKSTAQCNIWVGDAAGGGGPTCSGCGNGSGTSFGPGNTGGGQTGGNGNGGTGR